ncbi:hypothetical protein AMATHDRAFT_69473 [Amanita thiersii Skay4041]|uniref:Uncharacterized protein n=1 Tax=Amanita thiersii Skay4041 TaxID=703135 RepID=A0A2A9NED4_9AGAR|nr:hypothetical protein AMATHDRAFT_69473 [Amanita thiersii Skay4041]
MDDIGDEVRHLDETIASMNARRDKLIVQLDRCKIALAPYKKLPVDVLQHIFTLCVMDSPYDGIIEFPHPPYRQERPTQVILSHVCAHWRRIVLATPSLWAKLRLSDFLHNDFGAGELTEIISRIRGTPMSLSISQRFQNRNDKITTFVDKVLKEMITPHRIRELSLRFQIQSRDKVSTACVVKKLQQILCTSMQDLEVLNISMNDRLQVREHVEVPENSRSLRTSNGIVETSLPSLKVIHLDGSPWFYKCVYNHVNWGQLYSLSFGHISIIRALAILRQCRLLKTFSVSLLVLPCDQTSEPTLQMSDLRISLPHLYHLNLSFDNNLSNLAIRRFFDPLALPNLTSLSYKTSIIRTSNSWPCISDALIEDRLQFEKLQELKLKHGFTHWPLSAWKNACNLHRLQADLDSDDASDLGTGGLFPQLQYVNTDYEHNPGVILQMIQDRQRMASGDTMREDDTPNLVLPFKWVEFKCERSHLEPYIDLVDSLRKTGVELNIQVYDKKI